MPPKQSYFSKQCWLFLNKPSHWSKRSHLLATPSTTEPPDRAASQQKFTSMPSESCFMCVLPAIEGGERRKALKKKTLQRATPSCNSKFPSNMLREMNPRVLPTSRDLLFFMQRCFIVVLPKTHSLVLLGKYQDVFFLIAQVLVIP